MAFILISCNCPECDSFPEPLRIIYLDEDGNNLLANNSLIPQTASYCDSDIEINFGIKDYVINGSLEKYHIEFNSLHHCQENTCCVLIEFKSGEIDTLLYKIKENSTRCCTSYSDSEFTYNGVNYLGRTENTIGAYQVIKK